MSIRDIANRKKIATDFTRTLFVDAGAGSGKTSCLVSRILMAILKGLADVREVVAITFTNEGAASLRSRIQHDLERCLTEDTYTPAEGVSVKIGTGEKARIQNALQFLPLAHFSTIHSFCLTLLKERPVEAAIDPQFEMNVEGNQISVFDEAWASFILECARQKHAFLKTIIEEGLALGDVEAFAQVASDNPELEIYTEVPKPLTPTETRKAVSRVLFLAEQMHGRLGELTGGRQSGAGDRRITWVSETLPFARDLAAAGDIRPFLFYYVHNDWAAKQNSLFLECCEELAQIQAGLLRRHYDVIHKQLVAFVEDFRKHYTRYKRMHSALEFTDLLFLTRELLKNNHEVRSYFKAKFKYIFVDEAQDTDPLQMEIMFFLSEENQRSAKKWKDVRLASSKLFMVGDPKQSIYKFRRADIRIYEQTKGLIQKQGGMVLELTRNFRSTEPIIKFVNSHFEESFKAYESEIRDNLQPAFVPLEYDAQKPADRSRAKGGPSLHVITSPDGAEKADNPERLALEFEKLASFILELTRGGGPSIVDPESGMERAIHFSDILILTRTRTHVPELERVLEDAAIPHEEVGGKLFFNTEDVRGVVFALKAIDDPVDTISLFGALKSPVFGLTDQQLYDFVGAANRFAIFSGDQKSSNPVVQALGLLKDLSYRKETLQASGLIKEIFNHTGVCHVVLGEANGLQKSARFFRLLELVNEIQADHALSVRAVIAALNDVLSSDDPRIASVALTDAGKDAVRIMTIHGAKGLEAPVVILADSTSSEPEAGPAYFVLRDKEQLVIPLNTGGYYSLDAEALLEEEQRKERSESERLRYVAATRARDILAIAVPSQDIEKESFNGKFSGSLMAERGVVPVVRRSISAKTAGGGTSVDMQKEFDKAENAYLSVQSKLGEKLDAVIPHIVSVHEAMKIDPALFRAGGRRSRGTAYGSVIHRLMYHHVMNNLTEPEAVINALTEEEGVAGRLRDDLLEAFSRLVNHPRVREAKSSQEKYCEWDYYLQMDGRIQSGVIDLVYKDAPGKWIIIDYKTDDVSDSKRKKALDEVYNRQLKLYSEAFTGITGYPTVRAELVYSQEGE